MTLLTYNSKYITQSSSSAQSSSATLGDDSYARQTFTLSATQTVFVIYAANSKHLDTNNSAGFTSAINIDGTDHSIMSDSGYGANFSCRNTCFWIGTLAAGSHTVTGRFASDNNGATVTVSNRTLLIYIFNGNEFKYVESSTVQTTTSQSYTDDSYAQTTITPSGSAVALILYGVSNSPGTSERYNGKKIIINVAGTDYTSTEAAKSSNGAGNCSDSLITAYAQNVTNSSTAVTGRFAKNDAGGAATTVDTHILGVLLLSSSTVLDQKINPPSSVYTSNTSLTYDTQASISRTITNSRELLVIYQATKKYGTAGSMYGNEYGINISGSDVVVSRSSPAYTSDAESGLVAYGQSVSSGSYTINGRFAANYGTQTAYIDERILIAIWMQNTTVLSLSSSVASSGNSSANLINLIPIKSSVAGSGHQTAKLIVIFTSQNLHSTVASSGNSYANLTRLIPIQSSVASSGNSYASITSLIKLQSSVAGYGNSHAMMIIIRIGQIKCRSDFPLTAQPDKRVLTVQPDKRDLSVCFTFQDDNIMGYDIELKTGELISLGLAVKKNGNVFDLTGCSVYGIMKSVDNPSRININCTLGGYIDGKQYAAKDGVITAQFGSDITKTEGEFELEFVVTEPSGNISKYPSGDNHESIYIYPGL